MPSTERIKQFLVISISVYALLLGVLWLFYPAFNGCGADSLWCSFMYWTTESGGRSGSLVTIGIVSVVFGMTASTPLKRLLTSLRTVLVMTVLLAAFAYANENFIKATFHLARPSHTMIMKESGSKTPLDSVYSLALDLRKAFFRNLIDHDSIHYQKIDKRILTHWVQEAGYSFPSGHSFNAFLIATIFAYGLFEFFGKRITIWCVIPLVWAAFVALSRVVVGAHTPVDVAGGAALGLVLSYLLMMIPATRKLILPNTERFVRTVDQK